MRTVPHMNFQENPFIGCRDKAEEFAALPVKCPYFQTDQNRKRNVGSEYAQRSRHESSEHPCNARRDTGDKSKSLHAKSSLFRPICVAKELTDPDVNMY